MIRKPVTTAPELQHYSELRPYFADLYGYLRSKNTKFSQTSFAKRIGISPSALCNFLEGRRMLSEDSLVTVGSKLEWSSEQLSYAATLRLMDQKDSGHLRGQVIELAKARNQVSTRTLLEPSDQNPTLRVISRTLLASLRVPKYAKNPLLVAQGLGFSEKIVASELEQLMKSGAIVRDEEGMYRRKLNEQVLVTQTSSDVLRRYYRQMLSVASDKVRADNVDRRYFGTETFAFDPAMMPEARAIIDRCLDDLAALSSRCANPESVYHANVNFFEFLEDKK